MKQWAKQKEKGFTIVELLIVIVVIAILAAVTIVGYNGIRSQAVTAKRETDMTTLLKAIQMAREKTGRTLGSITGSYWSMGGCSTTSGNPDNIEPRSLPTSHACWARYYSNLENIGTAAGVDLSNLRAGDARGNPYTFDENEGEAGDNCRNDGSIRYFTGNGAEMVSGLSIPKFFPNC